MLSELPIGWAKHSLGEILSLEYGKSLPAKTRIAGDYPVYGSAGIVGSHNEYLVESQSIVVGRKGTVGAIYKASQPFFPIDTTYYVVAKNEINWDWLTALLESLQLAKLNEATGVPGLNRTRAYALEIFIPPLNEQYCIAEILSSVDASIQATRTVIEQAERVKRGLMEELLTGGLGSERVEGGEVPEGWQLLPLGDFAKIKNGFAFKSKEFLSDEATDGDVPLVVRMSDFNGGYVDTGRCKRIQKTTADGLEKFRLKQGDILVAMSGATVGKLGRVPAISSELYLNQRVGCMEPTQCSGEFLWQLVNTPFFQATVLAAATGNAQPNISSKELEKIRFALPPIDTQNHIVSALTAFDDFIAKHKAILEQQTRTKSGLLNDLLTGKVRTV